MSKMIQKHKHTCFYMFINIIIGFLIFVLADNFASVAYRFCNDIEVRGRILAFLLQIWAEVFLLYLYLKYVLKSTFHEFRIRKPVPKLNWVILIAMVAAAVDVFYLFFVPGKFVAGHQKGAELAGLLLSAILMNGLRPAITEEMVYRGLMMQSIEQTLGKKMAVIVSSALFAFSHIWKIEITGWQEPVLLLASCMIAGIALALVTYQTGSIWSSVIIHYVWNAFVGNSSFFSISTEQNFPAVFMYTIKSDNLWITGITGSGDNMIETTAPGIAGFMIIIIVALILLKKGKCVERKQQKHAKKVTALILTVAVAVGFFGICNPSADASKEKKFSVPDEEMISYIQENRENYPEAMLENLERNDELLEFVYHYEGSTYDYEKFYTENELQTDAPLFLQWDERWGYYPYGNSVVGISGCGPTCMAMVVFSLTRNDDVSPAQMAQVSMDGGYYLEGQGTSWSFLTDIAATYSIDVEQYGSLTESELKSCLDCGGMVICSMGPGDFTDTGHFIVIYDYSEDGFCVNDPFSRSNSEKIWDYDTLSKQWKQLWTYDESL